MSLVFLHSNTLHDFKYMNTCNAFNLLILTLININILKLILENFLILSKNFRYCLRNIRGSFVYFYFTHITLACKYVMDIHGYTKTILFIITRFQLQKLILEVPYQSHLNPLVDKSSINEP